MSDERPIRDIVLSIEAKINSAMPDKSRKLNFPRKLPQKAQDALEVVLEEHSRSNPITFGDLINKMNEVEPGCVRKGGDTNHSIKAHLTERAGVTIRWAT